MSPILRVENVVRDRLHAYDQECDVWKQDRESAATYFIFRELLQQGIGIWESICRIDENWRTSVLAGELDFADDMEAKSRELASEFARRTSRACPGNRPECVSDVS